jgi:hypothetical protein
MTCPCWACSDVRDYDLGFCQEERAEVEPFIGVWIKGEA